jgi:hypothetical protein
MHWGNSNAFAHDKPNTKRNSDGYSDSYRHGDSNSYSHRYCNSNGYGYLYAQIDAYAETYANGKTSSYACSSPVTMH